MMDIVFVIDHFLRGGAEVQLLLLAGRLHQRGWRVGILTMIPSTAHLDEIKAAGIPLVECATARTPFRMAGRMIRQLWRWKPSIVVTFNYHADILGRFCAKLARVPVVISSLRTAHVKTRLRASLYRTTEPLIDLTASNSRAALDQMVARRILTPAKTTVIPNGIVASQYPAGLPREEARMDLGIEPEAFAWLAVGNLLPAKDYPTLLDAAEQCAAASPRFRLFIAGGGETLEERRAEVVDRGLQGQVHFLGPRTDVPGLLKACDAYVLSSAWEGMPNTVMEAMASSVPVVATDVGGVRELVEDGVSGWVVPPRDAAALSEAMLAMMTLDSDRRSALARWGRERIERNFEIEGLVDRWEDELRTVAARKGLRLEPSGTPLPGSTRLQRSPRKGCAL
jgi:glycosyltransferase involved in cell wall biosynthesis